MNTPAKQINIGADAIAASGVRQPRLVMQKQGSVGRLYYSVKLRAVSRQLDVAAQSRGFTIKRCAICDAKDLFCVTADVCTVKS